MLAERRLDLPWLDAEAPDLDLVVDASDEFQTAAAIPAHQIAGPVHAGPVPGERVGDEPARRQAGPAQVTPGHLFSRHVQLAGDSARYWAETLVQHEGPEAGQRSTQRAEPRAALRHVAEYQVAHVDGDLGDAVHVDQIRASGAEPFPPGREAVDVECLTTEDHGAQPERREFGRVHHGVSQLVERRRGLAEHRHLVFGEQAQESRRSAADLEGDDDQSTTGGEGSPHLPHREVEGRGVEQGPHVVRSDVEELTGGGEQAQDVAVRDDDPLRRTGRTGGVDHVGRVGACRATGRVGGGK